MYNTETIEQIRQESTGILERLADREISGFKIKDLDFDNGVSLRGTPLVGHALKGVLAFLRVRTGFVDFAQKMTPEDWTTVSRKIKATEGETAMYAKIVKNDLGQPEITEVYPQNRNKKNPDDASYRQYLDWITEALLQSENAYTLKSFDFDAKHETMGITLLNNDRKVDVFGTDLDVWKMGDRFVFNGLRFDYAPFFERLICSNGNTATEYGFGAGINQAKFNNKKIQGIIERSLVHGQETLPEILAQSVQHLQNYNVSIHEFYTFRKFFESRNENGRYDSLIERYFSDRPFYSAYGEDVARKSYKWKSTADSGINAYDFFNGLTYLASHPDKIKTEKKDRTDLQIAASSLLFKKQLDMEDIASPVKISYPRLEIMH